MVLRADVEVVPQAEGVEIFDHLTGFRFELDGRFPELAPEPRPRADWRPELYELLDSLGLVGHDLPEAEVRRRQRQGRLEALKDSRLERLQALLRFCTEHVRYYRERRAKYDAALIETEDELARLPLMRKEDLRANFPDGLVADGVDVAARLEDKTLEMAATSGTTGERLQVLSDMELSSVPDRYEELWGLEGVRELPRTAVFTTPLCLGNQCHLGQTPYEARIRSGATLYLNSTGDLFGLRKDLLENVAEELHRFQPDFLLVNPVYLHWLGRRAEELGVTLPPVKLVLSCYQYASTLQRRAITRMFGAPVRSYYFATDLSGCRLGVECKHGRLHVRDDHCLLEIVGPEGRRPQGALGAVAATALASRVVPLVRYLIGDIGRLLHEPCDCVEDGWPVLELHGRAKDMMRFNDRWVTTREIDLALGETPGLDFYRCIQTGANELVVQALPSLGVPLAAAELVDRLRAVTSGAQVRVQPVKRLEPEPSLKYRMTESRCLQAPEAP